MPQLPSVSELLIGAHNRAIPESRPEAQLPQSFRNSGPAPKKSSETSPRHTEVYLNHPSIHVAGQHVKSARPPQSLHAYPGMAHPSDSHLSSQSHQSSKSRQSSQNHHGSQNNQSHPSPQAHPAQPGHVSHAAHHIHEQFAGVAEPSTSSSGRNSISSVGSDSHAPTYVNAAVPFAGTQMDYFSYRDGHRPRHVSSHSSSHSQSSSPQLHYRPRQESATGLITRATSYQSIGSQDSGPRVESRSPAGESPPFVARPRPASFSYAPGPIPVGVPAVSGGYTSHMVQPYHIVGPAPGPGQVPGPVAPIAYYNGATAGSGYPTFPHPAQVNMPYNIQVSPGAYGHEMYPHAQLKAAPPSSAPYLQMEMGPGQNPHARQTHHRASSAEDMASLATDPNHALINKRCIIKRRTRTGCLTCRKRRIKCDERKPHCFNCERSKKLCLGYEASTSSSKSSKDADNANSGGTSGSEQPAKDRHRSSVHDLM